MDIEQLDRGVEIKKRLDKLKKELSYWDKSYSIRNINGIVSVTGCTELSIEFIDFEKLKDQVVKRTKFEIESLEHEFYLL
jgi:hypothetical protein